MVAKDLLNAVHDRAVFRRRARILSNHIVQALPESGTVLDVGCGNGEIAHAAMQARPGLQFEGIDVFLRPHVAIPAKAYDGQTIPYQDRSFDWVTIVDVLHHTDDPAAVLREAVRVARKGIVIKDHLREGIASRQVLRFMDWVGNRGHDVRLPYNYLSRAEWHGIIDGLGLTVATWDEQIGLYPFPASLVFGRSLHFVARLTLQPEAGEAADPASLRRRA